MSKFFKTLNDEEKESDARSESDAASKRSSESSEVEEVAGDPGRNTSFFRKRSKAGDGSSSEGEFASARKIPTSSRGASRARGRGRGLTSQEAAERAERLSAEGRHPVATGVRSDPSGPPGSKPDAGEDSAEESRRLLGVLVVDVLTAMSRKREKGSKKRGIAQFATSILEAMDAYFEKRVAKIRAELLDARKVDHQEEAPKGVSMQEQGQNQPQPQPEPEGQLLTLVRQELAALRQQQQQQQEQFQQRMQQQLSVLEGIVLRPPLAASGQRKAASYAAAAAATAAAPKVGPSEQAGRKAMASEPVRPAPAAKQQERQGGPAPPTKGKAARAPAVTATGPPLPPPAPPAESSADTDWTVVGAKRKAGKASRAAKKRTRRQQRKKRAMAARLRAPKSEAVVITLQPDAEKKGVTYDAVMEKARQAVLPHLGELGASGGFRMRRTVTGARMLEVPGAASGPAADALAARIRASLDAEEARVSRPTKCIDMRVMGLDDSVKVDEVVAAIVRAGGCTAEQVRAGSIRADSTGMRAVTVSCPVSTAKTITGEGRRLLVGWVSAQVKLLEPRPLRCYRCHVGHHVGAYCAAEVDRSDRCFQCGQPGHKAVECRATPHCYACAAAGKPAEHRAGSRSCDPPAKVKGKVRRPIHPDVLTAAASSLAAAAVAAATPAAVPSRGAREETVMDC